ncbi:uncharacterized protein PADG_02305 [Paracoccidioides brasiliensis Pb18]|uniref:Uncharacterized protein n=1 Tax=Paracoccidioides brasiliensis (strain Pb18) TaxID=502780 RepID=C1G2D9_PARBD|nr:uncharacterized protein PADG_02305 [Paracoccidioides brasiliensis Pb18]EEH46155.2 hypothetical protein PADG_02305 [Paracoccidioides brasiliensis Pb18]
MSRTPTLFSISYIKSRTSFGLARTGLRHGAFNAGLNMVFSDGATWMVRFPRARMLIGSKTTIPVPRVHVGLSLSDLQKDPNADQGVKPRAGSALLRPLTFKAHNLPSCTMEELILLLVTGAGGLQRRLSIFNTSSGRTGNSATELEFLVFINAQNKYVEGKVLETYNG